jgi:ATP-binding cassette subfamily B protein
MSNYDDSANNPRSRNYKGPRANFRELLPFLEQHRRALTWAMGLSVLSAGLSLAQPLLIGSLITEVQKGGSVAPIAITVVVLILAAAGVNGFQYYLLSKTGEGVVLSTRTKLTSHLLRLPIAEFDRRRVGDLVSRVSSDSTLLRAVLTQGLVDAIGGALLFFGAVIAMAIIDPILLMFTLGSVVAAVVGISLAARRIRFATTQAQVKVGAMSASVERALSAIRTIRASRAEDREQRAISRDAESAYDQGIEIAKLSAVVAPIAQIAMNTAFIVVLGVGGYRVASGQTEVASLVTFVILLFFMVGPLIQAFGAYSSVMSALGALARVQEILKLPLESADESAQPRQATSETAIEFANVQFEYPSDPADPESSNKPVLNAVSFSIERGQRVAIVGPSGAGKSTIFSLIERFYEPNSGQILLDGQPVTDISRHELRGQIGYVEQDAPVLAGSLRENLLLGNPDASDQELEAVLRAVNLTEVLERDPKGLEAEVGESGIMLSGGERQRLAIARALLGAPPILLMDESTSALDGPNEQRMREALDAAAVGRTVVVIAHRLSTVVDSDQIIVLEDGKVKATGTHSELVKASPLYAKLAKHQLLV